MQQACNRSDWSRCNRSVSVIGVIGLGVIGVRSDWSRCNRSEG